MQTVHKLRYAPLLQITLPCLPTNQQSRGAVRAKVGLTGNGTDHGNRGEEASQALATHDGGCVVGWQNACQTEKAGLQNGTKCWGVAKTACQQGLAVGASQGALT